MVCVLIHGHALDGHRSRALGADPSEDPACRTRRARPRRRSTEASGLRRRFPAGSPGSGPGIPGRMEPTVHFPSLAVPRSWKGQSVRTRPAHVAAPTTRPAKRLSAMPLVAPTDDIRVPRGGFHAQYCWPPNSQICSTFKDPCNKWSPSEKQREDQYWSNSTKFHRLLRFLQNTQTPGLHAGSQAKLVPEATVVQALVAA